MYCFLTWNLINMIAYVIKHSISKYCDAFPWIMFFHWIICFLKFSTHVFKMCHIITSVSFNSFRNCLHNYLLCVTYFKLTISLALAVFHLQYIACSTRHFRFNISFSVAVTVRSHQEKFQVIWVKKNWRGGPIFKVVFIS